MALTVTYPPYVCFNGNPVVIEVQTTTTGVTSHRIHLRLIKSIGADIDLELPVINQKAVFDVSEFLQEEFPKQFDYFDLVNKIVKREIVRSFMVSAYELYNNDGIEHNPYSEPDTVYILQGGISKNLLDFYNSQNTDFYTEFITKGRFLSWQPKNIIIGISDIEKLYFYPVSNYSSAKLCIEVTRQKNAENYFFVKTLYRNSVYEINASPKNLSITDYADNLILSYDIYLTDSSGNLISERRKFKIDRTFYNNSKYFIFRNSFGVYDTIRTTGKTEIKSDFSFQIVDNARKVNTSANIILKTNSGLLNLFSESSKELNFYFDELFLSEEVYFVNNNSLIPITIISNSRNISEDGVFMYSFDFEYYLSYNDFYFSQIFSAESTIGTSDYNSDFSNDFNIS